MSHEKCMFLVPVLRYMTQLVKASLCAKEQRRFSKACILTMNVEITSTP